MPASVQFANTVAESFCIGQAYYGDIDISLDMFSSLHMDYRLQAFVNLVHQPAAVEFAKRLYLRDLYLACGCVDKRDKAWAAFDFRYRQFVTNLASATGVARTPRRSRTQCWLACTSMIDLLDSASLPMMVEFVSNLASRTCSFARSTIKTNER